MRLGVTGANGLLGSTIFKLAKSNGFEVEGISRESICVGVDLLRDSLRNKAIDVLVHCAANTDVEECETEKLKCYDDNIALTEKLALACRKNNIKLVFVSSVGIYGDYQETPYCEYDPICPTTIHHYSKWSAEKIVENLVEESLIIRTGWLFGGDWDMKKNFVSNRIKEAISSNGEIMSNTSQRGNPTYCYDVAEKIFELLKMDCVGIFNCVNEGFASRFEYVSEIIRLSKIKAEVVPTKGEDFCRVAKVSNNETAINFKLKSFGIKTLPHWKESLGRYLTSINYKYDA
ncbi:SDR family oxidoreductase [Vibrio harveyi]